MNAYIRKYDPKIDRQPVRFVASKAPKTKLTPAIAAKIRAKVNGMLK